MITTEINGIAAHDRSRLPERDVAARALPAAWRQVHELDPANCPFDTTSGSLLDDVASRLGDEPVVEIWDADIHTYRPAREVFDELIATSPGQTDAVVVHGDAAVPNVLVRDGHVAGIVDLGLLGVGDRWWDLAACLGSMARPDNALGDQIEVFLSAYGCDRDRIRERWFRLRYRLVFDLPGTSALP